MLHLASYPDAMLEGMVARNSTFLNVTRPDTLKLASVVYENVTITPAP